MANPSGPGGDPLLAVRKLGIDFVTDAGKLTAVGEISLTVSRGQVLAIVGESGSGKSVTALSLLGLLPATAQVRGSAVLAGGGPAGTELVGAAPATLRSVRGRRIGAVFQDPFTTFNPVMRVGTQIAEAVMAHARIGTREATAQVLALLDRVGLPDVPRISRSFPHELSGGQLQRAMIAMAISGEPDLLIADEPTTALDVTVQAGILDLLHELRLGGGMAILLITHDMGVAADLADDVVVMRHGQVMETGTAEEVFFSAQSDYTRELLRAVPRVDVPPVVGAASSSSSADPVAELRDVRVTYSSGHRHLVAVDGVSLSVPAGETVGLVGESGSGKTTLGKAIARLVPATSGSITVAGRDLGALRSRDLRAARAEIGFVFQNPSDSLNPRARVGAIVAEPLKLHTTLRNAERQQRVIELLDRVDLPADTASRFPHQLSGGQRQRVAIARALVLGPRLVIADEPTSALDVAVQAGVLKLIAELQRELGFGCLFISHDLAVVRQVSQQVTVMCEGRVVEAGPTEQVLSEPRHEYTRTLLASVPLPDPRVQRARRADPAPAVPRRSGV
ncbi:MAG TPA: ABC transporter ATP-binding protein [Streptosporangiaceae bacterium]|nr:ABC transporter ATP-binding protein [Streptosporangiaceae bacterium]